MYFINTQSFVPTFAFEFDDLHCRLWKSANKIGSLSCTLGIIFIRQREMHSHQKQTTQISFPSLHLPLGNNSFLFIQSIMYSIWVQISSCFLFWPLSSMKEPGILDSLFATSFGKQNYSSPER